LFFGQAEIPPAGELELGRNLAITPTSAGYLAHPGMAMRSGTKK